MTWLLEKIRREKTIVTYLVILLWTVYLIPQSMPHHRRRHRNERLSPRHQH